MSATLAIVMAPRPLPSSERLVFWLQTFGAEVVSCTLSEAPSKAHRAECVARLDADTVVEVLGRALAPGRRLDRIVLATLHDSVFPSYGEIAQAVQQIVGIPVVTGPVQGILAAKVKPIARRIWHDMGIDQTEWSVCRHTSAQGNEVVAGSAHCRYPACAKPAMGTMSRSVRRVERAEDLAAAVAAIASEEAARGSIVSISDGALRLDSSDTLVEEWLEGVEFCVDGIIDGPRSCSVVHEKTRVDYHAAHVEDGTIFTPPKRRRAQTSLADFVERGVRALGIDRWAFHAEIRLTQAGPRFIELNARPAGGLLWKMSSYGLGIDQFEFVARCLLDIPTTIRDSRAFAERAVYAGGLARADTLPTRRTAQYSVESVLAREPGTAVLANQENYEAFLLVGARTATRACALVSGMVEQLTPVLDKRPSEAPRPAPDGPADPTSVVIPNADDAPCQPPP